MAKSAILSVRILADAQDAVRAFQRTSSAAKLLDDAMNVARAGLLATGAAVTAFTAGAVADAAALEQSNGAVNAVFGDQSAAMEEMANSAATNLGLTKNEFNELATVMGSQLKNGGTAMEELAPKTNELITMGADLAAMFGGTTSDAVGALSSALRGERDPIERYGVSLNQAAIDAKAAEMGFQKVGGALSAEANQAATLALIMDQTTAAHGAFAREGNTLATQQQIIKAQWGDLSAQVGTYLLPVLTELVTWANTNMMPWLVNMASQIPAVAATVVQFGTDVANWVTSNLPLIQQYATVIGVILIPVFIRMAVEATKAFAAKIAGWALSGAAAVAGAAKYVVASYQVVASWVMMGVQAVVNAAKVVASWVMMGVQAVVNAAKVVASWVMMGVQAAVNAAKVVASWVMMGVHAAATAARVVAGWLLMATQSLFHAARMAAAWFIALGPVGWVIAAVVGLVALVIANWDKVVSFTQTAWSAVTQWISDKVTAARDWVVNGWNAVRDWTVNAFTRAKEAVFSAMAEILISVIEKGAAVIQWFRDLPASIREKLAGMAESLRSVGSQMIEGLKNGIKEKATAVVDAVKGTITNAIDGAKKLLGIKSPSRLFRNEIGAQIGAGLAIGIEGTASNVRRATEDMLHVPEVAAEALGTRPVELNAHYRGTSTPTSSSAAPQINITVKTDGFADPVAIADKIEKVFRQRDILLGVI